MAPFRIDGIGIQIWPLACRRRYPEHPIERRAGDPLEPSRRMTHFSGFGNLESEVLDVRISNIVTFGQLVMLEAVNGGTVSFLSLSPCRFAGDSDHGRESGRLSVGESLIRFPQHSP